MVDIALNLKTTSKLEEIANALNAKTRRKLRDNIPKMKQIVANAINKAVEKNRHQFIPTDDEAYELGVGSNGEIDTDKTNGAWLELLTAGKATQFSIQSTGGGARGRQFGVLQIVISEEVLFSIEESNQPIEPSEDDDAEQIINIPWMRWLIEGAPANSGYRFSTSNRGIASRTGGGIMVKGGMLVRFYNG
jgi:hypothetical protein